MEDCMIEEPSSMWPWDEDDEDPYAEYCDDDLSLFATENWACNSLAGE